MKSHLRGLGSLALLLLAGCDNGAVPGATQPSDSVVGYSYEEITVDISVGAERGTFSNLTQCRRVAIPNSDGASARWLQTGGAVVGSFPSGKGFVLDLGNVCGQVRLLKSIYPYVAEADWPAGYPMPKDPKTEPFDGRMPGGARWVLYVFENVRDLRDGWLFFGPDYFWRDGTEVSVHSIKAHRSSPAEMTAWRKRWNDGASHYGWLTDFYIETAGQAVFSGLSAQFEPLGDNPGRRNLIEEFAARPENAGKRWVVAPNGGTFGVVKGLPLHAVEQRSGEIDVSRTSPDAVWMTHIYRKKHDLADPMQSTACRPFRVESDPRRTPDNIGIRLFVDGEDTGGQLVERFKRADNGGWARDVTNMRPYDRETETFITFGTGNSCLNPRELLEETHR